MNIEEKITGIEELVKDHTKDINFLKEDRAETKLYIKQILGYIADIRTDIGDLKKLRDKNTENSKTFKWETALFELSMTLVKGLIVISLGILGLKYSGIL